jgi:uncharacterized protein
MPMSRRGQVLLTVALYAVMAPPALAQPRPGFDCAKAGSAVDRLICSDEALAKLDRELAEKYQELHRSLTSEGFAVLRSSQLKWLTSRNPCVAKEVPHDQGITCLTSLYTDRANDLNAQYRTAGGLAIENREISRHLPRLRVDESDSYPLLVGPKARVDAFNRYVSQRLSLAKGMFAASGIKLDAKPEGDTTFSRYYEVHRFDESMISIEIVQSHESYFGHGWRSEFVINWDLRHDRPLRIADIFRTDQNWQQGVYDLAMKVLRDGGDIKDPESWFNREDVDDDDAWLFDDDGAVLLFGHRERSMVGASAEAPIPYGELQPFLRPDAPMAVAETRGSPK